MKRDRAISLLDDLLVRLAAGDRHLDMVDQIWVFGSFARGAAEPGDVDVIVEYTADEEYARFEVRALSEGRNWRTPLTKALRGNHRGLQFVFDSPKRFEQAGYDPRLLYRRGDSLESARARLAGFQLDPNAGRAPRDAMIPAFEGLDQYLFKPVREGLVKLLDDGGLEIARVDFEDGEVTDPRVARLIERRWAPSSPLRRAAAAVVAYFAANGVREQAIEIQGKPLGSRSGVTYAASFSLDRMNNMPWWLSRPSSQAWVAVLNARSPKPLVGLRFDPLVKEVLKSHPTIVL